jgi:hypothetical protein
MLSPTARSVFAQLANRLPQTGAELEYASARYGDKISKRSAKQYIRRIRVAIQNAFNDAGLSLDPNAVLISEQTESRQVLYRLKARIIRERGSHEEAH